MASSCTARLSRASTGAAAPSMGPFTSLNRACTFSGRPHVNKYPTNMLLRSRNEALSLSSLASRSRSVDGALVFTSAARRCRSRLSSGVPPTSGDPAKHARARSVSTSPRLVSTQNCLKMACFPHTQAHFKHSNSTCRAFCTTTGFAVSPANPKQVFKRSISSKATPPTPEESTRATSASDRPCSRTFPKSRSSGAALSGGASISALFGSFAVTSKYRSTHRRRSDDSLDSRARCTAGGGRPSTQDAPLITFQASASPRAMFTSLSLKGELSGSGAASAKKAADTVGSGLGFRIGDSCFGLDSFLRAGRSTRGGACTTSGGSTSSWSALSSSSVPSPLIPANAFADITEGSTLMITLSGFVWPTCLEYASTIFQDGESDRFPCAESSSSCDPDRSCSCSRRPLSSSFVSSPCPW
mmetsp:Transcript_28123/g.72766  ORF Transcript_28123/g.72766 Transcript_28123/m.72766 type:complete len:414 (-) Transcript_28123:784-2025(-)